MDPASDVPRSPVAWNGVNLTLPDDWQVAAIEPLYLLFTHDGVPAVELKWQPVEKGYSVDEVRMNLLKQLRQMDGYTDLPDGVPEEWASILAAIAPAFDSSAFALAEGLGALCMHRSSGTVLMLRLLVPVAEHTSVMLRNVLSSLAVTVPGAPLAIRMFGFACQLPSGAVLEEYDFKPGLFSLLFSYNDALIRIERHGPANVVLQGRPFRRWIEEHLDVPLSGIRKDKTDPPKGAHKWYAWASVRERKFIDRLPILRKLREKFACSSGAAWVVEDENKLITVCADAASPIEFGLVESICHHVEILEG